MPERRAVRSASAAVPARAALAGNPSDGFGGRTVALTLPALSACVRVDPEGSFDVDRSLAAGGPSALLAAAVRRLACSGSIPSDGFGLHCESNIPPEVGLAGSSAIVVATLRALSDAFGLELSPDDVAAAALAAEVEELGITAGPQDRVVQAHGGLVSIDFDRHGRWQVERLDARLLPPLFVAWDPAGAVHSAVYHTQLRARYAAGDPEVVEGLERLAALALRARDAIVARDPVELARCIDASFDARASMGPLEPAHVRLVERARELGASANYAGSGGAVVGTLRGPADLLREAFERDGCGFQLHGAEI